ncbi:hypothetical protein HY417_01010 [Candidatus Kaiserbacteria bacterium]|nr:hypothetical protein [Candidatus Kaiserbacteria bacterium]
MALKGCLVLQRRFAFLGHELAVLLKERGVDEFCAYVHLRGSYDFLRAQKDILYTSLILDEDIQKVYKDEKLDVEYLKKFEADYGSVWRFIGVDRVVRYGQLTREYPHDTSPYTHEEMLRIVQVYAKRLSKFLDEQKPSFILAYQPGALGTVMLYAMAEMRGIPVLTIVPSATRDVSVVSASYDRLTWAEEIFRKNLQGKPQEIARYAEAKAFVDEFKKKPVIYSDVYSSLIKHGTLRQFEFMLPGKIGSSFRYILHAWRMWHASAETRTDYTTIHPFWYVYDRTKRKIRNLIGANDLYDVFDPKASFAFFALHFEPELSILMLSPFDTNQIEIVKRLAQSLPVGMLLYVKDHPQMTPFRPRRYYKELKKIPNVRLLRPELSSFSIVPHAKLVATITGSVGWEATLLGKPVITFGRVFYNALPSVARSTTPEELPELVKSQLGKEVRDEDTVRFVAALFEDGARCDLWKLWEKTENPEEKRKGLKDFADLVARKVRLVCK